MHRSNNSYGQKRKGPFKRKNDHRDWWKRRRKDNDWNNGQNQRKGLRAEWLWEGLERKQFYEPHAGSYAVMDPEPEPEPSLKQDDKESATEPEPEAKTFKEDGKDAATKESATEPEPEAKTSKEDGKDAAAKESDKTAAEIYKERSKGENKPEEDKGPQPDKVKKRKCAVVIGYCGAGFMGMQMNPGAVTIEAELERAIYRAGLMIRENYGFLQKVHWMRAARTDKGVHAACQLVSLKMLMAEGDEDRICEDINSHLPESIQCHTVIRVSKLFHAKNACTKRSYQYIMPTYILEDVEVINKIFEDEIDKFVEKKKDQGTNTKDAGVEGKDADIEGEDDDAGKKDDLGAWGKNCEAEADPSKAVVYDDGDNENRRKPVIIPPEVLAEVSKKMQGFRLSESKLKLLRKALERYVGTRNYHNFTSRKDASDPSCNRFIMSFECSDPYLEGDVEWVRLSVLGQSFLLNQIRKMVALAVQVVRGDARLSAFDVAMYSSERLSLAIAPGDGLYLDRLYFDNYNKNLGKDSRITEKRALLKWEKGDVADKIEAFKKEKITSHIVEKEVKEQPFLKWINYLRVYPTQGL